MDIKELSRTVDDVKMYVRELKEYLEKNHLEKYNRLESLQKVADDTIANFSKLEDSPVGAVETLHSAKLVAFVLQQIHALLDFKLYHGDALSKTRADKLMKQWGTITHVYRLQVRQLQSRVDAMVKVLYVKIKDSTPTDMQGWFHKWPLSIDLYQAYMMQKLDDAFKSGDKDLQTKLTAMIESDKSHALGERKFISPFLSLGLFAVSPIESVSKLMDRLGYKSKDFKQLVDELGKIDTGLVIICRHQPVNYLSIKPPSSDPKSGLNSAMMGTVLVKLDDDPVWKWNVKVWAPEAPKFLVLESVSKKYARVMSPWISAPVGPIPRFHLGKMLNSQLGRPEKYFQLRDQQLSRLHNPHVRGLAQHDPPKVDADKLSSNRSTVIGAMIQIMKTIQASPDEKLAAPEVWIAWRSAMLRDLSDETQVSTLLYLLVWLESQFKKDVIGAAKREKPASAEVWLQSRGGQLLRDLIGKNENIFSTLAHKRSLIGDLRNLVRD